MVLLLLMPSLLHSLSGKSLNLHIMTTRNQHLTITRHSCMTPYALLVDELS